MTAHTHTVAVKVVLHIEGHSRLGGAMREAQEKIARAVSGVGHIRRVEVIGVDCGALDDVSECSDA